MRRLLFIALALFLAAGCGRMSKVTPLTVFDAREYQWHKRSMKVKVHWNYLRPDAATIIADGYVEPSNPKYGLYNVRLELVGLDSEGNIVNSAKGIPADTIIMPPSKDSYFRMEMKLTGKEDDFTVRGSYYWFMVGAQPTLSSRFHDTIPLFADEPY